MYQKSSHFGCILEKACANRTSKMHLEMLSGGTLAQFSYQLQESSQL